MLTYLLKFIYGFKSLICVIISICNKLILHKKKELLKYIMFGYVTPCKMELKIKDYEKFKSYYCGLCLALKKDFGNIPRMALNYDMAFLAVLLDSISTDECSYKRHTCIVHPLKKRIAVIDNDALKYAAFCNVILTYFKLIDNINDDRSYKSKIASIFLKKHMIIYSRTALKTHIDYIENSLNKLSKYEAEADNRSIDEISDVFADLTGYILSSYINKLSQEPEKVLKENIYWLGYNLGKWIYIIDAWDDLQKDMRENKFNVINKVYNQQHLNYEDFSNTIREKIDFLLVACAANCMENLTQIPLKKNKELLYNILQLGLMEKIDIVFKRSEIDNAKSL
jgi:hypothetical protein